MRKSGLVAILAVALVVGLLGCENVEEPTSALRGNVHVMETDSGTFNGILVAKSPRVTVTLSSSQNAYTTVADANGVFSFENVFAGEYQIAFEYNGEEVTYRGNSHQVASLYIGADNAVELLNITISGNTVNIGNIRVDNVASIGTDFVPVEDDAVVPWINPYDPYDLGDPYVPVDPVDPLPDVINTLVITIEGSCSDLSPILRTAEIWINDSSPLGAVTLTGVDVYYTIYADPGTLNVMVKFLGDPNRHIYKMWTSSATESTEYEWTVKEVDVVD